MEGRIYVGFVQQGEERIHIGLDKSTNTNLDYVWFKFPSTTWTPSEIQGSLMIRPVLRAGKNVATSTREVMREVVLPRLFPNPGGGTCSWELSTRQRFQSSICLGDELPISPACNQGDISGPRPRLVRTCSKGNQRLGSVGPNAGLPVHDSGKRTVGRTGRGAF